MDAPKGYRRNDKGVLEFLPAWRRNRHDEAVWFKDGNGERFGCTAKVYSGGRDMSGHLCGKVAKHDPDDNGNPTACGVHSRAAAARRAAKSDARYAEQTAEFARQSKQKALIRDAPNIIQQIADGHNDPRSLCAEWIAQYSSTKRP
jgi:hypothetical protein